MNYNSLNDKVDFVKDHYMKTIFNIIAFLLISIIFYSCSAVEQCASCIEKNSGYVATDFCATPQEVSVYVNELHKIQGQDWECDIY